MNEWEKIDFVSFVSAFFVAVDCVSVGCERVFHHPREFPPISQQHTHAMSERIDDFLFFIVVGWKMHFPRSLNDDFSLSMTELHNQVFNVRFRILVLSAVSIKGEKKKKYQKGLRHAAHFSIHSLLVEFGRKRRIIEISRIFFWIKDNLKKKIRIAEIFRVPLKKLEYFLLTRLQVKNEKAIFHASILCFHRM